MRGHEGTQRERGGHGGRAPNGLEAARFSSWQPRYVQGGLRGGWEMGELLRGLRIPYRHTETARTDKTRDLGGKGGRGSPFSCSAAGDSPKPILKMAECNDWASLPPSLWGGPQRWQRPWNGMEGR